MIFLDYFLHVLNFVHYMTLAINKNVSYAANPIYPYLIPILAYKNHFINPKINPVQFIPLIPDSYFSFLHFYRYGLTTNTRVAMSEDTAASDFIGNLRKLCD